MAAPEPAPRRSREREREDESEDESDILEESPCGRWQKRREQVGTGGVTPLSRSPGDARPRGAVGALWPRGGLSTTHVLGGPWPSCLGPTPW